mmetsp:Transcript_17908/g.31655  ORF Transcript_17908/g.31655 Transcript_17908/m.31655 type:complete len:234 (-) Transcript_17908:111-812(-)
MIICGEMRITGIEQVKRVAHRRHLCVILFKCTIRNNDKPSVGSMLVVYDPGELPLYNSVLKLASCGMVCTSHANVENIPVTLGHFTDGNHGRSEFNLVYASWRLVIVVPGLVHEKVECWRCHPGMRIFKPKHAIHLSFTFCKAKLGDLIFRPSVQVPSFQLKHPRDRFRSAYRDAGHESGASHRRCSPPHLSASATLPFRPRLAYAPRLLFPLPLPSHATSARLESAATQPHT